MAKSKLSELNDHLFYQIERLQNAENPEIEIKRSEALSKLSSQVVGVHNTFLKAVETANQAARGNKELQDLFKIEASPVIANTADGRQNKS